MHGDEYLAAMIAVNNAVNNALVQQQQQETADISRQLPPVVQRRALPRLPNHSHSQSSSAVFTSSSTIPLALRPHYPLPSAVSTAALPTPPSSAPPRPTPPRSIAYQRTAAMEPLPAVSVPHPSTSVPSTAGLPSPPTTSGLSMPNTASTSASISGGESSLYISTPPLSITSNSPPLSADRPPLGRNPSLRRPESVQFGPRIARKTLRSSPSMSSEQDIVVVVGQEYGAPHALYPIPPGSEDPRNQTDDLFTNLPPSPTPSFPNPYGTLTRSRTTSSLASSTSSLRPRPRRGSSLKPPTLTLSLPGTKPSIAITTVAINEHQPSPIDDARSLAPTQGHDQSYFSPHTPERPSAHLIPPPSSGNALSPGMHTGVGQSYFSPHTPAPARTSLYSSLGTGSATIVGTDPLDARRERIRGHEVEPSRVSGAGFLAPPPSAALLGGANGSYWSPHTPDVHVSLEDQLSNTVESAITSGNLNEEKASVAESRPDPTASSISHTAVEQEPLAETYHLASKPSTLTPVPVDNEALTDNEASATDSSSSFGNKLSGSDKKSESPARPQLKLQTWDLDKLRQEHKKSGATRRAGSRRKDERNQKAREKVTELQKETPAPPKIQVAPVKTNPVEKVDAGKVDVVKNVDAVPSILIPANDPFVYHPQGTTQKTTILPHQPGHPYLAAPPPQLPPLQFLPSISNETVPVQRPNTGANIIGAAETVPRKQGDRNTANTLGTTPNMTPQPLTLATGNLPPPSKDWQLRGRSPSEPNVPTASMLGVEGSETGKERKRFGFLGHGHVASNSETNLPGLGMPADPKKVSPGKEGHEGRKGSFYERGMNPSFDAVVGWGSKVFTAPPPSLTPGSKPKSDNVKVGEEGHEGRKGSFYARGQNSSFDALVGWGAKIFTAPPPALTPGAKPKSDVAATNPSHRKPLPPASHPYAAQPQYEPMLQAPPRQLYAPPTSPPPTAPLPSQSTNRQYVPPSRAPAARVADEEQRKSSFEEFGIEIAYVGKNRTHRANGIPPSAPTAPNAKDAKASGHTKNGSSSGGGFRRMFGFGKKDKDKDKGKWI